MQKKDQCIQNENEIEIHELGYDWDINVGKWNNQENLKYAIFMDFHRNILSSKQKKRTFKVFEEMARFITTRNTTQCRSHHQKLQQRFKNFKKIISAVKNQLGRKQYKKQFNRLTNTGIQLVFEQPKTIKVQPPELEQNLSQQKEQNPKSQKEQPKQMIKENQSKINASYPIPAYVPFGGFDKNMVYEIPTFYSYSFIYF